MCIPRARSSIVASFTAILLALLGVTATTGIVAPPHHAQAPQPPSPDNDLYFLPLVIGVPRPQVLIAAAYIDSSISYEPDEAIMLWNVGPLPQSMAGWELVSGSKRARFPVTSTLEIQPGQRLWCTAQATAFKTSFGVTPACEWAADSDPEVLNLEGNLALTNRRGFIAIEQAPGDAVDVLVYGDENLPQPGWQGPPARLYTRGLLAAQGQVWQRKLVPGTGLPMDTDRATDWAGDLGDIAWGRRVRQPGWQGWDETGRLHPFGASAQATTTVAVGPEGLYAAIAERLQAAAISIDLSIYTFEHPELAAILAAAAARDVQVRILLEGSPPGGVSDLQKWCVAQIVAAGGDVRYVAVREEAPNGYKKRYRFTHAKFGVMDGRMAMVGTDNFNRDSMPVPGRSPVGGRRGVYLFTDAQPVIEALTEIFADDWAPDRFLDIRAYAAADPKYGVPPDDFTLPEPPDYPVDKAPFGTTRSFSGLSRFVVMSAPENALRPDDGLHALLARVGTGDEIALLQLYENKHWGSVTSNPIADPNPRLELLIDAARRGARVRLLLDSYFDDGESLRSNRATAAYLEAVADAEGLDLQARLGNPTLGGIHAKVLLVQTGGERWSAVGSLNGGETSYKLNREVVLMVDAPAVYDRLAAVFEHDWTLTGG